MTKDYCIGRVELADQEADILDLGYYVQAFDDTKGRVVYGIKIEKTDTIGNTSSEETWGLTYSYDEAEGWARKMAAGTVTPLSLFAITDDLMG